MTENNLSQLRIEKTAIPVRSVKRKRYTILVFFIVLFIIAGFMYKHGMLTPAVEIQATSVQAIYPSQTFTVINASGYTVAQKKSSVASKITGKLVSLSVEEGSRVKKNDIIARLENEDLMAAKNLAMTGLITAESNLEHSKAELDEATLSYNRSKELVSKGYIARSEFDSAEARYKRALASIAANNGSVLTSRARIREAEVALDYTYLRAPFDAVVLTKNADIGDIVTPLGAAANAKAAVVTLADMNSIQAEVDVSESNIEKIHRAQPCEIYLDAFPSERFSGRVHIIVPTADRSKASVMVKVAFNDLSPKIIPEMSVKVAFLSREIREEERIPLTVVLSSAVFQKDGDTFVFKILDNKAVLTSVTAGKQVNGMIEVLSGLNAGDKVVASPAKKISDGTRVKIAQ